MMKLVKILSLICLLTINFWAQTGATLTGKITKDSSPEWNAIVKLTSRKDRNVTFTSITDAQGNYRFENIPNGTYIITTNGNSDGIRAVGVYATGIVRLKNGENQVVNLEVESLSPIRETVTISADTAQTVDEVSKTVNIINGQEMRDRADFALAETLRTIPGFRVQQLGGFGRTASVKTRGLRNQDTAVLIDGVRFRDASAITGDASPFLSDFTLTSVSKIEVLRGSGSSLYGTNAIGGTIDFQTPKPQPGLHGNVSGAFGGLGLGRFRGNLSDATKDGKFGFNIGVSRTVYTKGIDGEDDARNTNFQSRIEYNPFKKTNISGRFFISDAYVRLNTSPNTIGTLPAPSAVIINAVPLSAGELKRYENGTPVNQLNIGNATFIPDANDADNFQKSKFFNGQVVLTHVFNEKLVFQGFYSGLKTSRKNENGSLGTGFQSESTSLFDGAIQTLNGHFNLSPNSFNEITAGYEYEGEKYGNDGFTPGGAGNFFTRAKQSSHTFYAQDLLQFFNNKLQIAGGFRAQFFNLETPEFSLNNAPYTNLALESPPTAYTFDGAVSYFFSKSGTKIRAHVGNGYRAASLYERFGTFYNSFSVPNSFVAQGNPFLKPERSIAFDAGVDQSAFSGRARFSGVYFYTNLTTAIDYAFCVPQCLPSPDPFGRFSGYYNSKGRIARGVETSADIKPTDSTRLFASYTFVNSDERNPLNLNVIKSPGIPAHQFSVVATQRFKRFFVNFDFVASSSYLFAFYNFDFATFEESYRVLRFKGNRRADLTAGYTFPFKNDKLNLRLFGTIENLFDYEYYENGFRTVHRNGRVGLAFSF